MKSLIPCSLAVLISLLSTRDAHAWGQDGHRITAEIAERNLNPKALAAVREILGDESLAEISNWGDEIRSDGTWDFATPWHYISIDDDETWEDFERAPEAEGDVLAILEKLDKFLRDSGAETLTLKGPVKRGSSKLAPTLKKTIGKRDALALYVHFAGDIHQPLHVGRRDDKGGNRIQVEWFEEEFSLHKVWDEKLIESTNLSYTEFSTFLNRFTEGEKKAWSQSTYLDWAKGSRAVRDQVYDFGAQRSGYFINIVEPPVLSYDYRHKTLPIVREQLRKGGFRLAAKLNEIFGSE
ncbi:S1/P1 nuclease [Verrucomicrobiales bacterium BCK34]|nr:S1/P1 nuclease [Verrucomicrobiales bacterium BCK34]